MTEKRFINDVDNGKLYDTKGEMYTIHYDDRVDFYSLWEFLNKLNDENEQLKKENKELNDIIDTIEKDYPQLNKVFPYKEPLFAIVEITDKEILIKGFS